MARAAAASSAPETALAVATSLTTDDVMAILQQSGMAPTGGTQFRRMRLDGGMLVTLDAQGQTEEMFPPKMNKGVPLPSLTVRIVEPPDYYNAFWLGPEVDDRGNPTNGFDPQRIGRPDLNKTFSRKYDDPGRHEYRSPSDEVFEQVAQATGKRGDFKGDIKVQIVPDDGVLTGEEPIFTLTLSASACLDWRGTSKNPSGGVVQEKNFIVQLAELAVEKAKEAGLSQDQQSQAVLDALTSLRLGGVVADVYLLRASNDDGSRTWTIPAFKPVHIESVDQTAALPATAPSGDLAVDPDDLPF